MNVIKSWLLATIFISCSTLTSHAQKSNRPSSSNRHKYLVTTQQKEIIGTYEQRKLYREFLTTAVEECPYISNFHIIESKDPFNHHEVVWTYDADGWADITRFYDWIARQISTLHNDALKLALTPYGHTYSIGGKIALIKKKEILIASQKKLREKNDGS